jgi:hypothetical protein
VEKLSPFFAILINHSLYNYSWLVYHSFVLLCLTNRSLIIAYLMLWLDDLADLFLLVIHFTQIRLFVSEHRSKVVECRLLLIEFLSIKSVNFNWRCSRAPRSSLCSPPYFLLSRLNHKSLWRYNKRGPSSNENVFGNFILHIVKHLTMLNKSVLLKALYPQLLAVYWRYRHRTCFQWGGIHHNS